MDAELTEILESLDAESLVRVVPADDPPVSSCWGGRLAGTVSCCNPINAGLSNHFKHKLCAACQSNAIFVPVERVRAIHPNQHALFTNIPTSGVWTEKSVDSSVVCFRVVNQTRKCTGNWLVIFRSPPPDFLPWAPLAVDMLRDGFVRLRLAKGTLVPDNDSAVHRHMCADAAPCAIVGSVASGSSKRARVEHEAADVLAASTPPLSFSSSSPLPAGDPLAMTRPPTPHLGSLLALHEQLDDAITLTLAQPTASGHRPMLMEDEDDLNGAAPLPSQSEPAVGLHEEPTTHAIRSAGDLRPQHLTSTDLRPEQRHGLAVLQETLRKSLALLRLEEHEQIEHVCSIEEQEADASLATWLGLPGSWHSSPPSPPGSRGSARATGRVAKWSSGLCACLQDPCGCARVALCWPIIAGQLGQKLLRSRSLCKCFALSMLLALVLVELPIFLRAARFALDSVGANSTLAPPFLQGEASLFDDSDFEFPIRTRWDLIAGLCIGALILYYAMLRMLVRQRDGIPGSPLRDFCVALCCYCCGLCQLARHENLVAGQYGGLLSPTGEKQVAIDVV
jgi:Cys-rich protein (TIGR01571 family)